MRESDEFSGGREFCFNCAMQQIVYLLWKIQISKRKRIKTTYNNQIFKHVVIVYFNPFSVGISYLNNRILVYILCF